jgi:diguanylate cyclase (GGDEF)-like protein
MTADIGIRAFGADAVVLFGAAGQSDALRVLEQRHWAGIVRNSTIPCDAKLLAQLAAGEAVAVPEGMLPGSNEWRGGAQLIPLITRHGLTGVLAVGWRWAVESFDRRVDADLASVFAQQAGSALERAYAFGELQSATMLDPLTGLGNRRAADTVLASLAPGDAVVMIDLDHFKRVNDEFGHPAGDRALRELGSFLAAALRDGDRVARYGGEEFIMFVRKIHPAAVESLLERLRLLWNERNPITTFSIGAAVHQAGVDPRATLQTADIALYQAKERGRDRVVVAA